MLLPPLTLNAWLRFDIVKRSLERLHGVETVLEVGPGEGALGARLARRYSYVGLEPDLDSFLAAQARLARSSSGEVLHGSLEKLPPGRLFDLVCAFEVLEHIEDDAAALEEWRRRVRPSGWIMLSVPAWPSRWGALDEKAGHYRRYEPAQMKGLLQQAGFVDVRVILYGFPLVYALQPLWNLMARRALARGGSMEQRTSASGRWLQPPHMLGLVTQAVAAPFRLLQRPFATRLGTGLVAMARRPETGY